MLDNNLIQSTSSWPFVEIRKLLKDRKDIISKKKKITFQTGYGPSGLPHIGTFGEVARTTMMINALNHIQKINHELITFSDDMDGLRKIPENVPNSEILKKNLGKPLTAIPDPFKKFNSFGEHNNEMLKVFLKKFKFKFDFKSSTVNYKNGVFNNSLMRVLEKYEEIMNIILPTLRADHLIAQSTFHCNLQLPSKIFVSTFSFLLSKITFPVFLSILNKGISSTLPVFGQIGKKGQ